MNNRIHNVEDLLALVEHFGFLPFFKNRISGFSIEEFCPPELWFSDDTDGPWEWKGPAIKSGRVLYGKFFNGKAEEEIAAEIAEVRAEGEKTGRIKSLLELLTDLGAIPESLESHLQELDEETLKRWIKLAAKADSMDEFLEQIK